MHSGKILLFANQTMPRNEPGTPYRFRQDSHFLYYVGIDKPGLVVMLDVDKDEDILFGTNPTDKELVWTGAVETIEQLAEKTGITKTNGLDYLPYLIANHPNDQWHILPPYTEERRQFIRDMVKGHITDWTSMISKELIRNVVEMRLTKEPIELSEIENTLNNVTSKMYKVFMHRNLEGKTEQEIVGEIEGLAWQHGCQVAYSSIVSRNGQILHNEAYHNTLKSGDLLLVDAGAEAPSGYATDITRTIPVSGKFTDVQKDIYNLVLKMQAESMSVIKPGIAYSQVHKHACLTLIDGLKSLGLMKGHTQAAFENRAHELFFPHGLGHAMGLDVHDMGDLGKVHVSYDEPKSSNNKDEITNLRFARTLREHYVLTVEPGIYFIPLLIDKWQQEGKFREFINYSEVVKLKNLGGIRIEDDIVVTQNGYRLLGHPIPKMIAEIETTR
jgi:Xaa-Pro aminopeptidase